MTKKEKKSILEILETIKQAVAYMFTTGNAVDECVDAVSMVENSLNKHQINQCTKLAEKIKTDIIQILERKIELSEQVAMAVIEAVQEIEKNVQEVKATYTMVFMPYKASMWDSLESIYFAAEKDPMCNAYVVPIPYFDRNPDGSVAKSHYEGDLFPKDIPITLFTSYDIEKEKPDAIFVHNPYDGTNYVTTVAPQFYSGNLKKHTECLVYVPYFLDANTLGINFYHGAVNENADIVVLQSQKYKKMADKYFNSNISSKMVGLGSPKIDSTLKDKKDIKALSASWQQVIGDKRVVLICSTLRTLLENDLDYIHKMQSLFNKLKQYKKIAVIWRAHPLNDAAVASMRPQLAQAYSKLKSFFIDNQIGIYDEEQNCHISMSVADACITEESSVTYMYGVKGKPIIALNIRLTENLKTYSPQVGASVLVDGVLWFSAENKNALYKTQISTGETHFIAEFPNELSDVFKMYKSVHIYENKLYFIPFNAKNIAVYNMLTAEFENTAITLASNEQYIYSAQSGGYIYLVPAGFSAITIINLKTSKQENINGWYKNIANYYTDAVLARVTNAVFAKNKLWLTLSCCAAVLEIDVNKKTGKLHDFSDIVTGIFTQIAYSNGEIMLLVKGLSNYLVWDGVSADNIKHCKLFDVENLPYEKPEAFLANGDDMYIVSSTGKTIYKLDNQNNMLAALNTNQNPAYVSVMGFSNLQFSPYLFNTGERLLLVQGNLGNISVIDLDFKSVERLDVSLQNTDNQEKIYNLAEVLPSLEDLHKTWFYEGVNCSMDAFLDMVQTDSYTKADFQIAEHNKMFANCDGSCGEKIYKYVADIISDRHIQKEN